MRGKKLRRSMDNPDSMLLYGKNSVLERLRTNPESIREIFLHEDFNTPSIERLIKRNKISADYLSFPKLAGIKRAENLQGIIARVDKFKYSSFEELLTQPKNKRLTPIFLDKIFDPQNLGAIIRTAACFGKFTIVIPRFRACEITEAVLHIASGSENHIRISMVSNLTNAIIAAKKSGYWIMGTFAAGDAKDINKISLPFPLGLVLGSEGEGIHYGVQKQLDIKARIPMKADKLSFNVAMACAIFCYEISKQKTTPV